MQWNFVMRSKAAINQELISEKHSITMVTGDKLAKPTDLQLFCFGIDFLLHNPGLKPQKYLFYGSIL